MPSNTPTMDDPLSPQLSSPDTLAVPKSKNPRHRRTYRCSHCARIFKRSEHCARHELVHTQERPYPCNFCERRYARKDLVKRHERSLHAKEYRAAHPDEFRNDHATSKPENAVTLESIVFEPQCIDPGAHSNLEWPSETVTRPTNRHPITSMGVEQSSTVHRFRSDDPGVLDGLRTTHNPTIERSLPPSQGFEQRKLLAASHDLLERSSPFNRMYLDENFGVTMDPFLPLGGSPFDRSLDLPLHASHIEQQTQRLSTGGSVLHGSDSVQNSNHWPNERPLASVPFWDLSGEHLDFVDFEGPQRSSSLRTSQCLREGPVHNRESGGKSFKQNFDDGRHQRICADANSRLPPGELSEALLPSRHDLNNFFSGYLECFHQHFPIIHVPTFDLEETPAPLIFAMCSIGAQYRLDRRKAKTLFALAGTMTSYALRSGLPINSGTPNPAPLWIMQTRVLLSLCGMFSEKANVVLRSVENLGLFAIDYRLRQSMLQKTTGDETDWESWISKESSKRLLCGMFIVSNLISTTYGINPGFSHTHDLEFEALDDESLWDADSAEEWTKLRVMHHRCSRLTVRETMVKAIFSEQPSTDISSERISSLTLLLITHAINVHCGAILQVIDVARNLTSGYSPQPAVNEAVLNSAFSMLSKCHDIISNMRGWKDHSETWNSIEGPLMFNCQALLRVAYVRLFSNITAFNRLTLLTDNPMDIATAVKAYVQAPQRRSRSMTQSVMKAYEGLLAPIKVGYLLVRKTAALSWSIEHAVAGWDAALLLTKWVHTVETDTAEVAQDADEIRIIDELKALLPEAECDYDGNGSLAAAAARVWSTFMSDVWVWGVTTRMGNILHELAIAYEEDYKRQPN